MSLCDPAKWSERSERCGEETFWGPSVDQLFADEGASQGKVNRALADHLGTIRDIVTHNTGTPQTTSQTNRVYDAFGNTLNTTGSVTMTDLAFAYTGRMFDSDTGLQNNLHRWYDPNSGRWISEDPIGFAAGDANLYRYVGNEPTGAVDSSGLKEYKVGKGPPIVNFDAGAGPHGSDTFWLDDKYVANVIRNLKEWFRAWPNARKHLAHYLKNTGVLYEIDLLSMLRESPSARSLFDKEKDEAKAFVETLTPGQYDITSGVASNGFNEETDSRDWYYAVGGYSAWGQGEAKITCLPTGVLEYSLAFDYRFADRYNWDGYKEVQILGFTVTDEFMGRLHRAGVAREFSMWGSVKRNYIWRSDGTIVKEETIGVDLPSWILITSPPPFLF